MTVWPQEHDDQEEEKLHTVSKRDSKVLEYFFNTVGIGVAIFLFLTLFLIQKNEKKYMHWMRVADFFKSEQYKSM